MIFGFSPLYDHCIASISSPCYLTRHHGRFRLAISKIRPAVENRKTENRKKKDLTGACVTNKIDEEPAETVILIYDRNLHKLPTAHFKYHRFETPLPTTMGKLVGPS